MRDVFALPDIPNFFGGQHMHRLQASLVECAHGLSVDGADIVQALHRLMDGHESATAKPQAVAIYSFRATWCSLKISTSSPRTR